MLNLKGSLKETHNKLFLIIYFIQKNNNLIKSFLTSEYLDIILFHFESSVTFSFLLVQ